LSKIVNGESVEKHVIKPYNFKPLEEDSNNKSKSEDIKEQENIIYTSQQTENNQSKISEEVIEKLLGKIEELSNNIVKIQEEFKNQLNECKKEIEIQKQKAFEEGYKKGKEDASLELNKILEEKLKLLDSSIKKIDNINKVFEEKILSLEKELVSIALDIAKEVIQKEVSENSKEIAYNLAKALMEDIKDATQVTIKVNPKDASYLKEELKNVKIIEDDAVKEGGVVIISDVGNIDAEIKQRFKTIKDAILEGNE